jgi:hypothetical protein
VVCILVSGLINLETTLNIESFPDLRSRALPVSWRDLQHRWVGDLVLTTLERDHIPSEFVTRTMPATAQSVILYDANGARAIPIPTDLKDVQDRLYLGRDLKPHSRGAPP